MWSNSNSISSLNNNFLCIDNVIEEIDIKVYTLTCPSNNMSSCHSLCTVSILLLLYFLPSTSFFCSHNLDNVLYVTSTHPPGNCDCYRYWFLNGTHGRRWAQEVWKLKLNARAAVNQACFQKQIHIEYIYRYTVHMYRYFAICKLHTAHIFVDGWWEIEILCKTVWKWYHTTANEKNRKKKKQNRNKNSNALLMYWIFVILSAV